MLYSSADLGYSNRRSRWREPSPRLHQRVSVFGYSNGQANKQGFCYSVINVYLRQKPMDVKIVRAIHYDFPLVVYPLGTGTEAPVVYILAKSVTFPLSS